MYLNPLKKKNILSVLVFILLLGYINPDYAKLNTLVNIKIEDKDVGLNFKLENKRNLDRKTINLLRNKEISTIIN